MLPTDFVKSINLKKVKKKNTITSSFTADVIVILLLLQGFFGTTSLNTLQIIGELILIVLLSLNLKVIFQKNNIILLIGFIFSCSMSFFVNSFMGFLLNTKIFLICILTLIYFENKIHLNFKIVEIFIILNALYTFLSKFGIFYIENLPIYTTNYSRSTALFGSPHNAAFIFSIYLIYLLHKNKYKIINIVILAALWHTQSLTSMFAFVGQLIFYLVNKIIKINSFIFIFVSFLFFALLSEFILENKYLFPRWYSLEIMLPMILDYSYWIEIFNFFPYEYSPFLIENYQGRWANEIGLIKIFIEGGFVFALILLIHIYKNVKFMIVFVFLSALHYTYLVNIPFSLYLALQCNQRIKYLNQS